MPKANPCAPSRGNARKRPQARRYWALKSFLLDQRSLSDSRRSSRVQKRVKLKGIASTKFERRTWLPSSDPSHRRRLKLRRANSGTRDATDKKKKAPVGAQEPGARFPIFV